MSLDAGIRASRLGFGLLGQDLGLGAGILAWGLGFWSQGWWGGRTRRRKRRRRNFPICESIGHRPLRCRCPKKKKKCTKMCANFESRQHCARDCVGIFNTRFHAHTSIQTSVRTPLHLRRRVCFCDSSVITCGQLPRPRNA